MNQTYKIARLAFPLLVGSLALIACARQPNLPQPASTAVQPTQVIPSATPTQAPSFTPAPPATATPAPFKACSPLDGLTIPELQQIVSNPFQAPLPGRDDGHHGTDFAYYSRGSRKTMLGLPIYSVLAGRIASVIDNRQPFGNMVIVETPLEQLPADLL
jgi:murein DD-endopeptidase MepM/ murein hydrolase activator NlpD